MNTIKCAYVAFCGYVKRAYVTFCGYVLLALRDIWRVFCVSLGSWSAKLLTCVLIPAGVAFALVQIFITRGAPQDTITSFIFFSTLYLFWAGLFNASTAINGTQETGEWVYWVLGTRRSILGYVVALFVERSLWTLLTVLAFLGITAFSLWLYASQWLFALAGPYIKAVSTNALFKTPYPALLSWFSNTLSPLETAPTGLSSQATTAFLMYFGAGLACAGLSGVVWGLCSSVIFKKTTHSLCFAVCITMLVTIFSAPSMQPSPSADMSMHERRDENYPEEQALRRDTALFLPVLYTKASLAQKLERGKTLWEIVRAPVYYKNERSNDNTPEVFHLLKLFHSLSYLLPQRYFFNIAHTPVPRLGYLSRGLNPDAVEAEKGETFNPCERFERKEACWCVFCLGLMDGAMYSQKDQKTKHPHIWLEPRQLGKAFTPDDYLAYYKGDINALQSLWLRTASWEVIALLTALLMVPVLTLVVRLSSYDFKRLR